MELGIMFEMDEIPLNQPYRGVVEGHRLIKPVSTKLYFVSIVGRDHSKRYEWDASGLSKDSVANNVDLAVGELYGDTPVLSNPRVAIAMPHVTTLYEWGDPMNHEERETNLHLVARGKTKRLPAINSKMGRFKPEIGCPAEIRIINEEMVFRAGSQTMEEYLGRFVPDGEIINVVNPNMVREFMQR
jgi:hypothetical protein